MSRAASVQSILTSTIDETNPNAVSGAQPRTPLFNRRRSQMIRGKTMDEATEGGRSGRMHSLEMGGLRPNGNAANGRYSAMNCYFDVSSISLLWFFIYEKVSGF